MNYYFIIFCMITNLYLYSAETQPELKSSFQTGSNFAMLGIAIGSCIQFAPKFFSQISQKFFDNQSLSQHSQTINFLAGSITLISGLYLWRSNSYWHNKNISLQNANTEKEKKIVELMQDASKKNKNIDEFKKKIDYSSQDQFYQNKNKYQNYSNTVIKEEESYAFYSIDNPQSYDLTKNATHINYTPQFDNNTKQYTTEELCKMIQQLKKIQKNEKRKVL